MSQVLCSGFCSQLRDCAARTDLKPMSGVSRLQTALHTRQPSCILRLAAPELQGFCCWSARLQQYAAQQRFSAGLEHRQACSVTKQGFCTRVRGMPPQLHRGSSRAYFAITDNALLWRKPLTSPPKSCCIILSSSAVTWVRQQTDSHGTAVTHTLLHVTPVAVLASRGRSQRTHLKVLLGFLLKQALRG